MGKRCKEKILKVWVDLDFKVRYALKAEIYGKSFYSTPNTAWALPNVCSKTTENVKKMPSLEF